MSSPAGYTLAVCAEMVFHQLPFVERVATIHELGFAVEIWDWSAKDLDALAATGATFTSMTGYVSGDLVSARGADELLRTAEASIAAAERLGRNGTWPHLNLHGTGLGGDGLPIEPIEVVTPAMWLTAERTLRRVAALGECHGVVFTLENLNTVVDHPGVPFARAADTRALVDAVGSPHLRMNLDLYHAQIGEGNLVALTESCIGLAAEIQVADVPGRYQPGTGEIHYPAIAAALVRGGYTGVVGLEAWAAGDDRGALAAFRTAFTPD
jgi:hydroxypyruvate isomerase